MLPISYRLAVAIFLFSCLLFPASHLTAQGPISGFQSPADELVFAIAYGRENYDTYLSPTGDEARELRGSNASVFAEYGLNSRSALVVNVPYISNNEDNKGLQDASVWFKYRNQRTQTQSGGYHNFFTAVGGSFPLGSYPVDDPLAIGQRAGVFSGRLVYQYDAKSGWFIHGQSGIDFQFSPDSRAAWPVVIRSGFGAKHFYVEGWWESVRAFGGGGGGAPNQAVGTGSSWTRLGGTLYVPVVPRFGLFGSGAYVLSGKFIGQATRWNLGAVVKFGR